MQSPCADRDAWLTGGLPEAGSSRGHPRELRDPRLQLRHRLALARAPERLRTLPDRLARRVPGDTPLPRDRLDRNLVPEMINPDLHNRLQCQYPFPALHCPMLDAGQKSVARRQVKPEPERLGVSGPSRARRGTGSKNHADQQPWAGGCATPGSIHPDPRRPVCNPRNAARRPQPSQWNRLTAHTKWDAPIRCQPLTEFR